MTLSNPSNLASGRPRTISRMVGWPLVSLCLGVVVFLAYFQNFMLFGFYGDDAVFFGESISRTWPQAWDYFLFCLTKWPQGRPLGIGLNLSLLPHLIGNAGGMSALHMTAGFLLLLNMVMIYFLVRRISLPVVAAASALFYGLCPAHTVRHQLTYAFGQISILCALLSVWAAMSRRWLLYGVGSIITVTMAETAAVAALVASISLSFRPTREWIRDAALITAIWIAAVSLVLFTRKHIGDPWGTERVGEILGDPMLTLSHALQSAITGPRTHFDLIVERLLLPIREWDVGLIMPALVAGGLAGFLLLYLHQPSQPSAKPAATDTPSYSALTAGVLIIAGIATMTSIYAAYFRSPWFPADWRSGFMSGVHLVPVFGSSLLVAGFFAVIGCLPRRMAPQYIQASIAAISVALLTAFGVIVQREYVDAHRLHREFWVAFHELCRDAGDQSFVLILDQELPNYRYVDRFSWTTEWMPHGLFDYRRAVSEGLIQGPTNYIAPVVIAVRHSVEDAIEAVGQDFRWRTGHFFMLPKSEKQQPRAGHVAVMYKTEGRWQRMSGEITVLGGTFQLMEPPTLPPPQLPLRPLAKVYGLHHLLGRDGRSW